MDLFRVSNMSIILFSGGIIISCAQSVGASLNDHVLMQMSDADAGEIHQFGWLVALLTSQGYDENT
jgi:hypothetical protein